MYSLSAIDSLHSGAMVSRVMEVHFASVDGVLLHDSVRWKCDSDHCEKHTIFDCDVLSGHRVIGSCLFEGTVLYFDLTFFSWLFGDI